jgi:putative ABC transport system permease protein
MKYLPLVLRNLARNRRRTILTILSIAVCLFLFSVLMSVPGTLDLVLKSSAASLRLICHSKAGLAYTLPESYQSKIAALPHVEGVDAWNWFGGIYHEPSDQFPNLAIDQNQMNTVWTDWNLAPEYREAFKRERIGCIVGASTMSRFHFRIGQQIALRGTVYPVPIQLKIVGAFGGKTMPDMILFHRDYMQERVGRTHLADMFWIKVDRSESIGLVIEEIDREFANSSSETQTESEAAFQGTFVKMIRPLVALAEVVAMIVLLVVGAVSSNTAAISIRERSREIAVMRSLGFRARTVMAIVLIECVVLGVIGGILGIGAAYITLRELMLGSSFGLAGGLGMPPQLILKGLMIAAAIGLLSGFIPARRAASRTIVEGLRSL